MSPAEGRTDGAALRPLRIALAVLLVVGAEIVLLSLGTWQLRRLAWKEELIARAAEGERLAPVPLALLLDDPPADLATLEYRRARATGRFDHAHEFHVYAPLPNGGGTSWNVVTPLLLAEPIGAARRHPIAEILVVRGIAPDALKEPAARPASLVEGLVVVEGRLRSGGRSIVTPAPDLPGNRWMSRDINGMRRIEAERRAGGSSDADDALPSIAPVYLEATAPTGPVLRPLLAPPAFANNHLGYAVTWFGLAASLVLVVGAAAVSTFRDRRGRTAGDRE